MQQPYGVHEDPYGGGWRGWRVGGVVMDLMSRLLIMRRDAPRRK